MPAAPVDVTISSLRTPADAAAFRAITEDWISRLFTMTDADRDLLDRPVERIIEPGGDVLVARAVAPSSTQSPAGDVVGCVALVPYGDGVVELSKMGVTPAAQGGGLGRRLIDAAVDRARELGARRIFLGTNRRLEAAVHLYERAGFRRIDRAALPVADYYARADVLMELALEES